jgi:hypothetical protein
MMVIVQFYQKQLVVLEIEEHGQFLGGLKDQLLAA